MTTIPTPSRFLHFAGDTTSTPLGQVLGPNTMGEVLTTVSSRYDTTTDQTTVGLAYGVHEVRP